MNQQPQGYMNPNFPPQGSPMPAYNNQTMPMPAQNQPYPNMGGPQMPPAAPAPEKKGKGKKNTGKKKKSSLTGWIFLGIFLMLGIIVLGGVLGYNTAINARQSEYNRKSKLAAAEQYQLALLDIQQEKYANAKTRLDYVIQIDQNYPGAAETYAEVITAMYPKATPTPEITATPEPTATPDTRGEEEMFQGIQTAMYSQDWASAIAQMDALRDKNLSYRGMEVDGMYYIALRNYGINLINAGYLESGVYKITLAESFGPIDGTADGMRQAARSYLAGAGFWEINWEKAMNYYATAAQSYPNIFDQATGMSANQRYAKASFEVGNLYLVSQDSCGAIPYFQQGLAIEANETIQITATAAYLECYPPEPTSSPDEEAVEYSDGSEGEEYTEDYSEG